MAISLQNYAGSANVGYYEFFCDNVSDIELLPTTTRKGLGEYKIYSSGSIGSSCFCLEDKNVYLLGSNGWVII